ncbi:MAG: c-type cytochrome [Proteobacteria bacterium]|nr:c-type cytochrome [Pseudomonadota bacterium]
MAAALLAGNGRAAADGRALYAACIPCHGARGEGIASTGAPNIAGGESWYLQRQLQEFAAGRRGAAAGDTYGAAMRAASGVLRSDADRLAVATYVSSLRRIRSADTAPAASSNGRNYYNAICSACHGANGRGNEKLGAPRLAGLATAYVARQLNAFKTGQRGSDPADRLGAQMRAVAAMLPDEETAREVVRYATGLEP